MSEHVNWNQRPRSEVEAAAAAGDAGAQAALRLHMALDRLEVQVGSLREAVACNFERLQQDIHGLAETLSRSRDR